MKKISYTALILVSLMTSCQTPDFSFRNPIVVNTNTVKSDSVEIVSYAKETTILCTGVKNPIKQNLIINQYRLNNKRLSLFLNGKTEYELTNKERILYNQLLKKHYESLESIVNMDF